MVAISSSAALVRREPNSPPASERRGRAPDVRFSALVDGQFDFIWRSLRGLGVPAHSADDAAQEVFWIACQKLDAIVPGSEKSFLFSTALGVAANRRRAVARSRETADTAALDALVDDAPNPEELSSLRQARALLDHVLDAMPLELRTVFVLFELEELTTSEIASLLELAPGTVSSRLRRAREAFHAITRRVRARVQPGGLP
jgi:RNA polymerase sigma-70 factor, ECF subfamily